MPPSKLTKTATGAALVAGSLALLGNAAPAFTQGPRYWAVNSTSDRFRHDASSVTVSAPDCIVDPGEPSGITVNLRVDIIDEPDVSRGTKFFSCDGSYAFPNSYSSLDVTRARGHFLQVRTNDAYATLNAK